MKKHNFTLVELLVVILLAAVMLLMGAAAYSKLADQQSLLLAAGTAQGVFERARANAIKTKRVTWVFFLDGDGDVFTGTLSSDHTPYELIIVQEISNTAGRGAGELITNGDDDSFIEIYRAKLPTDIAWVSPPVSMRNKRGIGELGISESIIPNNRHSSLAYRFPPKGRVYRTSFGRADGPHELRLVNIDLLANADDNADATKTPLFEYKSEAFARYPPANAKTFDDAGDYKNSAKTIMDNGFDSGKPASGSVVVCYNIPIDDIFRKMNEGKYTGLVWKTLRMDSPMTGFVKVIDGSEEALTNYANACQTCYKRNATTGNFCDNCKKGK